MIVNYFKNLPQWVYIGFYFSLCMEYIGNGGLAFKKEKKFRHLSSEVISEFQSLNLPFLYKKTLCMKI